MSIENVLEFDAKTGMLLLDLSVRTKFDFTQELLSCIHKKAPLVRYT